MSKRVMCKFFANGGCIKGENCNFSHDRNDHANNICTFYQRGACSYGSRCRYEHVKVSHHRTSASSSWRQICSFAAAGSCPHGDSCPRIHGDLCSICGKHCLHPYRPDEREEHIKMCQRNNKQLEALKLSQEIECSVCFELVLSKPSAAERRFGLLSECDHPFCNSCIRNWRSISPASGMDVNSALRACPVCRKLSYFVVPSDTWFSTPEEKQEIITNYKDRLKSIDCKYFDFGNGTCPFSTICFYRHTYMPERIRPRPRSYRPHRHRPSHEFSDEDELLELVAQLALEDELEDLYDADSDGFDDEDAECSLETALFLMHLGLVAPSSDDED